MKEQECTTTYNDEFIMGNDCNGIRLPFAGMCHGSSHVCR